MSARNLTAAEERAADARVEAIRDRVRDGRADPKMSPVVDPRYIQETTDDALKGEQKRRPEVWKQVMESSGFVWYEPTTLDRLVGQQKVIPRHLAGLRDADGNPIDAEELYVYRPHAEGQWRRTLPTPVAYTVTDLCSLFRTPETFATWLEEKDRKHRLKRLGIVTR